MGSINFNSFKNVNYSQKNYTYTDIFLDMAQEPFEILMGDRTINGNGRDMKVAYDLNAIRNSIINLFNTLPGERILLPDYGCDLRRFIFEPITDSTSRLIGRTIKTSIEQWEPRVVLVNINVDAYISRAEYEVTLVLEVPFLQRNEKLNVAGILNRQGFRI
jgi:phage baseplate assembly protein W